MAHCQVILDSLRARGYRITPQREFIVQTIAHSDHHLSAEQIYAEMQQHTQATNIATIYRTMEMLCEEGLAYRTDLGEGRTGYATYNHGPHIHLVCRKCKTVIDADPGSLDLLGEEWIAKYGFKGDLGHISVFGLCQTCQG